MTASIWLGSISGGATSAPPPDAQNPSNQTFTLVWRSDDLQGKTVSAQAALSQFSYTSEGGSGLPLGNAAATISSYRTADPGFPFHEVNAPVLNQTSNVFEIVFELQIGTLAGDTSVSATLTAAVFYT